MQNGLQQTSFPSGIYFDVEKLSLPTMASYKWNNGIYFRNGSAVKLEEPLHEASVSHLTRVILKIQETYLKNTQVHCYYSVIPNQHYYLAGWYPTMDYPFWSSSWRRRSPMTYIDLFPLPHWRLLLPDRSPLAARCAGACSSRH